MSCEITPSDVRQQVYDLVERRRWLVRGEPFPRGYNPGLEITQTLNSLSEQYGVSVGALEYLTSPRSTRIYPKTPDPILDKIYQIYADLDNKYQIELKRAGLL